MCRVNGRCRPILQLESNLSITLNLWISVCVWHIVGKHVTHLDRILEYLLGMAQPQFSFSKVFVVLWLLLNWANINTINQAVLNLDFNDPMEKSAVLSKCLLASKPHMHCSKDYMSIKIEIIWILFIQYVFQDRFNLFSFAKETARQTIKNEFPFNVWGVFAYFTHNHLHHQYHNWMIQKR